MREEGLVLGRKGDRRGDTSLLGHANQTGRSMLHLTSASAPPSGGLPIG
jgi:hypothetical protein